MKENQIALRAGFLEKEVPTFKLLPFRSRIRLNEYNIESNEQNRRIELSRFNYRSTQLVTTFLHRSLNQFQLGYA